jgi:hypothetical protein
MRLHTNLDYTGISHALQQAKRAGHVAWDVTFQDGLVPHGSRTHPRAYEVQLGTWEKDSLPKGYRDQNGQQLHVRRFKNTGDRGASSGYYGGAVWAATWDEWGWFIAFVFAADPDARFGHYASYADFTVKTGGKFGLEPTPEYRAAGEFKVQQAVSAGIDEDAAREALRDEDRVNHDTVREQAGEGA